MIYGKLREIMLKWSDIPKVLTYRYCRKCYTESFRTIPSYALKVV
jgi:hypothetical protein